MEREIEKKLRHVVRDMGGECLKWVSPGTAGVPDRIVILPGGRVVFVELKDEKGRLSKQQKVVCRRLAALGLDVRVVRGFAGVAAFLYLYEDRMLLLPALMVNKGLTIEDVMRAVDETLSYEKEGGVK